MGRIIERVRDVLRGGVWGGLTFQRRHVLGMRVFTTFWWTVSYVASFGDGRGRGVDFDVHDCHDDVVHVL